MAIEIVNGYGCTNCSEAAQASRGIDPHRSPTEVANEKKQLQQANDVLIPNAVDALTWDGRPRARLDYA
jgi:hypothetical protein